MVDAVAVAAEIKRFAPAGAALLLDSRKIRKGDVFFAVKGVHTDGRAFIEKACGAGASCVVAEKGDIGPCSVPVIEIDNLYRALGPIAAAYYGNSTAQMIGIAVTGTNGKTTTTMLSTAIIAEAGKSVVAAGNVGPNALGELEKHRQVGILPDFWVLELSSFQLETTESLHCDSAALLNITEDHIDWHGSMEKYAAAKRKIFSADTVRVLNREDPGSMLSAEGVPSDLVHTFGSDAPKKIGDFGISDVGALVWLSGCIASASPELLIPMNALRIRGLHNAMNALAATALTLAFGIPLDSILRTLREYKGEPHRVQLILRASDIDYVDDSKGTNVGAVVAALAGFGPKKVVLILGGDGKGQDFAPLKAPIETHAKGAVFIGRDAPLIEKEVDYPGLLKAHAKTMAEAVREARAMAKPGDTILLSPACASWDMFKDYADRSAQFVAAAKEIAEEEGQLC